MTLRFGWREFCADFRRSIPMILQTAILLLIMIAGVNSVISRFAYLRIYEPFLQSKGYVLWCPEMMLTETEMRARLSKVSGVSMIYQFTGAPLNMASPLIYSDALLEAYQPELLAGKWVISAPDTEQPQVVVNESSGYHIGDTIPLKATEPYLKAEADGTLTEITDHDTPLTTLYVTGIFSDDARMMLFNPAIADTDIRDYRLLFSEADSVSNTSTKIVMSRSEALKFAHPEKEMKVRNLLFLNFSDDITYDEQTDNLKIILKENFGPIIYETTEKIYAESRAYCWQQVWALLPVLIGTALLLLTSMISVNGVSAMRRQRLFTIYRLCGLSRAGCICVIAVKAGFVSATALLCALAVSAAGTVAALWDGSIFRLELPQMLCCFGAVLCNVLIAAGISMLTLGRTHIRDALKEV